MFALVTDPDRPSKLDLRETPAPVPASGEAVVDVAATSLNRGELGRLAAAPAGQVPGWDLAGVVRTAAADGSGPPAGARVAGVTLAGAWAEQVAVPTSRLVALPDDLDVARAAALPLAGLTAVGLLRVAGTLVGRELLVTGASGAVGRLLVQLGARAGARVTAVVSSEERGAGLEALGAERVGVGCPRAGFDVVLDAVGGASLAGAIAHVAPGGTVVAYGNSSGEKTAFDVVSFYGRAPGAKVIGYTIFDALARGVIGSGDLAWLVRSAAAGTLEAGVSEECSWREIDGAIERLRERRVVGKAVIHVG